MLSISSPLFVAAEDDDAVDVVEVDADADFENESEAVETVVSLKECAWHDCWDKIAGLLRKKQSSS